MGDLAGTSLESSLLSYVPRRVFARLETETAAGKLTKLEHAELFADLCRINALYMIARAGSGHIGSSFSSLDIMSWLVLEQLDRSAPNRDGNLFFSSKGHDAPGYYAALIGVGHLPEEELHALRRITGLPGHPDVGTPHIIANTGSLGMGISKAKGMIRAHRSRGEKRRVFVLTGDGELQEGQIWESLAGAVHAQMSELTVIVDHNKLQSDGYVADTSDLGDLRAKFESFGVRVSRISGHSLPELSAALTPDGSVLPHVIIADTIKGHGVAFMEATHVPQGGLYKFHSGAPNFEEYEAALRELSEKCKARLADLGLGELTLEMYPARPAGKAASRATRLVDAYGAKLQSLLQARRDLFVLDADLGFDLGIRPLREKHPDRFVECGIAEMDMVSQAGGLALQGALPIVHSFACFLSQRPNEHIYNNASERTKVIYTAGLSGLLPAGPGHSHQGVRDIAALGAIPGLDILQPVDGDELARILDYAVSSQHSTYLRLCALPWELPFDMPKDAKLVPGTGTILREGRDGVIIAYGPVMLSQAFVAAEELAAVSGIELSVVNLPWLNRVDAEWLASVIGSRRWLFSVDDHYVAGGLGQLIAATLLDAGGYVPRVRRFGVRELPACGAPDEVLAHHGLDAESLVREILASFGETRSDATPKRELSGLHVSEVGSNGI